MTCGRLIVAPDIPGLSFAGHLGNAWCRYNQDEADEAQEDGAASVGRAAGTDGLDWQKDRCWLYSVLTSVRLHWREILGVGSRFDDGPYGLCRNQMQKKAERRR